MKISFVIPAYNEEGLIGACLASILADTKNLPYQYEIIVVNNASTDNTKKIAVSYSHVQVVDEPKKGITKARQAGYNVATGDIIANVDADNILPSGWTKKVCEEFLYNKKLVGLSGPLEYYDLPSWIKFEVKIFYMLGYISYIINNYVLKTSGMLQGGNYIIRKSALDQIGGFDTSLNFYGEDTDIARRLQKVGFVKFTFRLPMYSSGRRLQKEGVVLAGWRYIINYFSMLIYKKPIHKKHAKAYR